MLKESGGRKYFYAFLGLVVFASLFSFLFIERDSISKVVEDTNTSERSLAAVGSDISGDQILIYDWDKGEAYRHGSPGIFIEGTRPGQTQRTDVHDIRANFNWTSPTNYANGKFYMRIHIRCLNQNPGQVVSSDDFRLMLNFWQQLSSGVAEKFIAPQDLPMDFAYRGNPIIKTFNFNVADMEDATNVDPTAWVPFNWSQPRVGVGFFPPQARTAAIDFGGNTLAGQPTDNTSFPVDLRATVVLVAPGKTFKGWNYWTPGADSQTGDCISPTTSITAPTTGATVLGTYAVNATASDNKAVSKVEFYVASSSVPGAGVLAFTDTSSPYTFNWNTTQTSGPLVTPNSGSPYKITVKSYDANSNTSSANVSSITVNNGGTTPTGISVDISASPAGPLIAPGATNLSWTTTGNPTSCDATGSHWSGTNIVNGSAVTQRTGMTPGTYVFGIVCHKTGSADATDSVTVVVNENTVPSTTQFPLSVTKVGSGSGTVTSVPEGISCRLP